MKLAFRRLAPLALALTLPLALGCERPQSTVAADEAKAGALGLRVRLELLQKLGVDGLRVDVATEGDHVRLSGEVRRRATAELAEKVARQVDGVGSVSSELRISGEPVPENHLDAALARAQHELDDAALATRVRLTLVDRMGSDGFRIGITAAAGVVTLEFPPSVTRSRRKQAERLAERLPGVHRVVTLERK